MTAFGRKSELSARPDTDNSPRLHELAAERGHPRNSHLANQALPSLTNDPFYSLPDLDSMIRTLLSFGSYPYLQRNMAQHLRETFAAKEQLVSLSGVSVAGPHRFTVGWIPIGHSDPRCD
jgi:hypothetical protein